MTWRQPVLAAVALLFVAQGVLRADEEFEVATIRLEQNATEKDVEIVIDATGARERSCTLEELCAADEVFLASTVREVMPVIAVDAHTFEAPGPVSERTRQAVAERIAVDAREARVQVTPQAVKRELENVTDARLIRLRMQSKSPAAALEGFTDSLAVITGLEATALPDRASPEDIYNRERAIVSSYRVVPLVWLPRVYGLSARVRDWTPPGAGEFWPLADVWLDGLAEPASEEGKQ